MKPLMNLGDLVRLTTGVSINYRITKKGLIGLVLSESIVNPSCRNCFSVLWQGFAQPVDTFEEFLEVINEEG